MGILKKSLFCIKNKEKIVSEKKESFFAVSNLPLTKIAFITALTLSAFTFTAEMASLYHSTTIAVVGISIIALGCWVATKKFFC